MPDTSHQQVQEGEWVVWRCATCGDVYADNDPKPVDLDAPPECANGEKMQPVLVVPREVAERLAEALEENQLLRYSGHAGKVCAQWEAADEALAEFRAVFPKAEEA